MSQINDMIEIATRWNGRVERGAMGMYYVRYDFPEPDALCPEDECGDIVNDWMEAGFGVSDVQVEHDCITMYVTEGATIMANENYISDLNLLREAVRKSAKAARDDAGYGGRHDDGGASRMEEQLRYFEDGMTFAMTGKSQMYGVTLEKLKRENDPEYKEFLRLKEKFGE